MERDRWKSFPAGTLNDRLVLALLGASGAEETTLAARSGAAVTIRQEIVVDAPHGDGAAVVSRISFPGAPGDDDLPENPWDLAERFLARREEEARRLAGVAVETNGPVADGARHVRVEHEGRAHTFLIAS